MTTPALVVFLLLAVVSICAILLAIIALLQTQALWRALKRHETECRATDAQLFEELRKQFATCTRVQQDILHGIGRLEGIPPDRRIHGGHSRG